MHISFVETLLWVMKRVTSLVCFREWKRVL